MLLSRTFSNNSLQRSTPRTENNTTTHQFVHHGLVSFAFSFSMSDKCASSLLRAMNDAVQHFSNGLVPVEPRVHLIAKIEISNIRLVFVISTFHLRNERTQRFGIPKEYPHNKCASKIRNQFT